MKKIVKPWVATLIILIVAFLVYFFVPTANSKINQMIFYLSSMNLDMIKEYILSFGIWAPIISFLLMVLQSVIAPIPAFLITLSNAAIFGWVKGAILSWSSAMAGAVLCFYIARGLGRDAVEKLTSKFALKDIDGFFEKYGKHTILIARLLPFISFDLVSYAAGLTSMNFWSFFIATGIGQLPATIVYSYVGGMLTGGAQLLMSGLLILFALSIAIYVGKKVWNEKRGKNDK
ncbi:TPA: TVP38/TMEM64 family protein [Clostridium perfringens]|uniref:TVP38/TMEM64 family protein n=1 Tax=Clostridium perfringens TaxID=1502 RepID=UPI0018997F0D|nr:TVP38/TMEM64 family protein [Clostridium perfringens]EJT6473470.1 TVP38/TMEM64 family protein [Clostridium perfringens]EJT6479018.1 TVP38/TMEM64 family protein [Clostridium perfringens]EJT6530467.1 TVP38/TMEM64 family protein [Clostridium perfringens]MDH5084483.1 TVP38/TMEM64 family inner membrane protein YdjZ [Clostridium perfringens]MDK0899910.1 TVP38/TMEM64 family protein [Clostridium perfringens]